MYVFFYKVLLGLCPGYFCAFIYVYIVTIDVNFFSIIIVQKKVGHGTKNHKILFSLRKKV